MKLHCLIAGLLITTSSLGATQSDQFMVVTEQRDATQVGVNILRSGGNAIDAAVAIGYALAVVNPCCGNIGGGGFMLIHRANGENIFINFREKAPAKASKNMFVNRQGKLSNKSDSGYLAVGVPGTVLGFNTALKKYGTLSRQQVMAPAIQLATDGYRVTATDASQFVKFTNDFKKNKNVATIFLNDEKSWQAGQLLVQSDLAHTLTLIATQGSNAFYKGSIAKEIVASSKAHGGILSLADFENYTVDEQKPIQCLYHGYTVLSAPSPSSGGVILCEMLNILGYFPLSNMRYQSVAATRTIIEAMRYGFIDRNSSLGDPDFVNNPVDKLLSPTYANSLADIIKSSPRSAIPTTASQFKELTDTTHYSVVDADGNAVSVTYTLNGFFGSRVIAGNTGFFLNNEMDDFSSISGVANKFGLVMNNTNEIAPGKRPLSSMTPTIVLHNGKLYMVLGSPGGPRIITSVLLTLVNVLDFGMTLQQAVDAPRYHYQALPDVVYTEPFALPFLTRLRLESLDYRLIPQAYWSAVEAIFVNPINGRLEGVNDRRRPDGLALGN
jgi:gamma-glutamyltranspeptidase/glutathione hydrolase